MNNEQNFFEGFEFESEMRLSDLNPVAERNLFEASEEANRGENHPEVGLIYEDNSIAFQDPNLRLA